MKYLKLIIVQLLVIANVWMASGQLQPTKKFEPDWGSIVSQYQVPSSASVAIASLVLVSQTSL